MIKSNLFRLQALFSATGLLILTTSSCGSYPQKYSPEVVTCHSQEHGDSTNFKVPEVSQTEVYTLVGPCWIDYEISYEYWSDIPIEQLSIGYYFFSELDRCSGILVAEMWHDERPATQHGRTTAMGGFNPCAAGISPGHYRFGYIIDDTNDIEETTGEDNAYISSETFFFNP